MLILLARLSKVLGPKGRRQFIGLLLLATVAGFFQLVGVSAVVPFIALATNPGLAESNPVARSLASLFNLNSPMSCVAATGVAMVATVFLSNMINALAVYYTLKFGADCRVNFSVRLLRNYSHKSYFFFMENNTSILSRNILDQTYTLVTDFITAGATVVVSLVSVTAIVMALVLANPGVAVVTGTIFTGGYVLIYGMCQKYLNRLGRETVRAEEERYKISSELLTCQREARLMHCQEPFIERFRDATVRSAQAGVWAGVIGQMPRQVLETLGFLMTAALVSFYLFQGRALDSFLPKMSLYIVCAVRLLPQLQLLFAAVTRMRFSSETLEILHEELSYESRPLEAVDARELVWNQQIKLNNLTYQYPGTDKLILDNLSLTIPKNHSVGFVGATGAGKTTLVNILLGLLSPSQGEIVVDSQAVSAQNLANWQASLGFVPQDIVLVDDTITANIAFGVRPDEIRLEQVRHAARLAQIESFVNELPNGFDTQVGERGLRLSGGQRQRLGIARALYRDPSIVVFDEATSALDGVTEKAVMDAVTSLGQTKTLILIAHRLTTLKDCNQIFVLEKGRVVDSGTYAELLERNETFQSFASHKETASASL
ncbi:ABC transporter ATP-binding protein [bacterium]|nr:ABC transporter ATP-binding protein [bacterium]